MNLLDAAGDEGWNTNEGAGALAKLFVWGGAAFANDLAAAPEKSETGFRYFRFGNSREAGSLPVRTVVFTFMAAANISFRSW